ncbi:MAG TPA: carbon-nitrogen hydrolase family protein [Phycisphaerae bacterium]|nr:carbon-nitrogen hydrolase family protein [Phycisphaerae bacterium]HRR83775.1 carbon-nitrogen hydrolase family protein [Phycisphaerae bacterium]
MFVQRQLLLVLTVLVGLALIAAVPSPLRPGAAFASAGDEEGVQQETTMAGKTPKQKTRPAAAKTGGGDDTAAGRQSTKPAKADAGQIRVAICQILCIDGDAEGNFRRIENALEVAAAAKAQLACFPESAILGWENPDAFKLAGPIPGPHSDRVAALARKYKMMISIGIDELAEPGCLYDSAILVDEKGKILLKHRKLNVLPELMDPPYSVGKPEDIKAVDTPLGRIGMLICADTFTEEYVKRAGSLKPDVLLVPYGWAAPKEKWPGHAKNLHKTVAQAAQWAGCPVVGTDLVGMITHGPWTGQTYGAASVVADRQGNILVILRDRDVDVQVIDLAIGRR